MTITKNHELSAETFTEDDADMKEANKESGDYCVGCGRDFSIYASSFRTEDDGWVCPYCFYDPAQGWKLDPRWHTNFEFHGVVYQPRTRRRKAARKQGEGNFHITE
jgi:hypothetical protein